MMAANTRSKMVAHSLQPRPHVASRSQFIYFCVAIWTRGCVSVCAQRGDSLIIYSSLFSMLRVAIRRGAKKNMYFGSRFASFLFLLSCRLSRHLRQFWFVCANFPWNEALSPPRCTCAWTEGTPAPTGHPNVGDMPRSCATSMCSIHTFSLCRVRCVFAKQFSSTRPRNESSKNV